MLTSPDYSLCDQTVTSYRLVGDQVIRSVHPRAFLDYQKVRNTEKTGSKDALSFALIIPGDPEIAVGDKVVPGEGPELEGAAKWRELIPAKSEGVCVVKSVDRKYMHGMLCHTEIGG